MILILKEKTFKPHRDDRVPFFSVSEESLNINMKQFRADVARRNKDNENFKPW